MSDIRCPICNKNPSDEVFDGGYYCKKCDIYFMDYEKHLTFEQENLIIEQGRDK